MTLTEAYIKAGYDATEAGSNAATLFNHNQCVRDYYNKLIERKERVATKALAETIASPLERQQILSEILRARLIDFTDEGGQPKLSKDIPNNRAAKEFYHKQRLDRDGNPVISKSIKLNDPISAIQELNKMDGSYAPSKHLVAQRVQFEIEYVERPREGGILHSNSNFPHRPDADIHA